MTSGRERVLYDESLTVDGVLGEVASTRVFFEELTGNNGDRLILQGAYDALGKAGITPVASPLEAETIVITGGGGMIESSRRGIGGLREHLDRRPEQAVIVLPQSYKFETLDFAALFEGRSAPVTLFARERYSLEILMGLDFPRGVRIGLDHDLAFRLKSGPFIDRLRGSAASKHVLIVERADGEATTAARHTAIGVPAINRFVPAPLKIALKRRIRAAQASRNAKTSDFVRTMSRRVQELHPETASLPVFASDISDPGNTDFEGFCRSIAEAAVVVSNRLHVGVLAAMIGKPTYVLSNNYHKIAGIAAYSMGGMDNVSFVDWKPLADE